MIQIPGTIKGTVSQAHLHQIFFMNHLPLGPWKQYKGHFDFFRIRGDILWYTQELGENWFMKKTERSKISWHCPFKCKSREVRIRNAGRTWPSCFWSSGRWHRHGWQRRGRRWWTGGRHLCSKAQNKFTCLFYCILRHEIKKNVMCRSQVMVNWAPVLSKSLIFSCRLGNGTIYRSIFSSGRKEYVDLCWRMLLLLIF